MLSAVRVAKRLALPLLALLALPPGAVPLAAQAPAAPAAPAAPETNPLAVPSRTPAVRVTLSDEDLVPGDRVRVLVRPREETFLVVLHADPAGRVRVLFPLDPGDSQRVPGATQRSIPSRDGGASLVVASPTGDGAVLAAVSRAPFRVAAFASGGHWDVRAFPRLAPNADPEGELVAVARRMAAGARFDYAVAPYRVGERIPVVASGRGAYGTDADSRASYPADADAASAVSAAAAAAGRYYYDDAYAYYDDAYLYGYPLYYAGLFPALRWPGFYSPCVVARGRMGWGLRLGCVGPGRLAWHQRRPWVHFPERRGIAQGDLAFPGNPSFGEPRLLGEPVTGPILVTPGAVPDAAPAGGMVGVPSRPLGISPRRPQPADATQRRPISPRMP